VNVESFLYRLACSPETYHPTWPSGRRYFNFHDEVIANVVRGLGEPLEEEYVSMIWM
jgi:hypothetical protein